MKSLSTDYPIDTDLKVVKDSDGTNSALEISKDKVRVKDLEVTGTTIGIDTESTIVDSSLSDGSTNPVENNAVFDGLATKLNLGGGAMTGAITTNSTFDGVDIATRDGVLTTTTALALGALPKAGGTMSGNVDFGDARLTNLQRVSFNDGSGMITELIDNDDMSSTSTTKISTSESVKAYVDAVPLGCYSKTLIKVMPTEFMVDDGYIGRHANIIDDDTTDTLGFRMGNVNTIAHAFVKIPDGYKATHVQVLASASTSNAVICKTFNYTTGATADLETFDFNTDQDITDVAPTTTNDLVIKIIPASTSTIIYGARVTIAST